MAKAFANQGANIVLLARRGNLLEENAKAISEEFGVETLAVACDITDEQFKKELDIDLFVYLRISDFSCKDALRYIRIPYGVLV